MYKKVFGIALIAHLVIFAYIGLRSGDNATDRAASETSSQAGASGTDQDDILEEVEAEPELSALADIPPPLFTSPSHESLPASIDAEGLATGILFDLDANSVIWEKESQEPVRIASMTKMMTALLAFEAIEAREDLAMETVIKVSNAAFRIGGSQVWLDPRESFTMEELLITVMVKSANDSSYLIGEYIENGDMDRFIRRMNERAEELDMTSTRFLNAHGLPEGATGNTASCQDLVRLAAALYKYDKALEWASIPTYDSRAESGKPTILANHNQLIQSTRGVNGLKTGYTKAAGFCITATCERDGRRLVAVTTGFKTSKQRDRFTKSLIDWGYRQTIAAQL